MVYIATNAEELLSMVKNENIQLLLIDLELNHADIGYEMKLIRYIREETTIPIIIISSQVSETAKIMALNMGADDFATVEDSPLVLLARIKAQLRRYTELAKFSVNPDYIYRVGELEMDDREHLVMVRGGEVKLTSTEYQILRLLIREKGKVLSIDQIYERIWHMSPIDADNVVAVHIRHIREKIESNPKEPNYLKVIRGMGYKVG